MPWTTLDFRIFKAAQPFVAADSRSLAVVQFPPVPGGQLWRVEQVQVQVQTAQPIYFPGVTASLFDQGPSVLYLEALAPFGDTGFEQIIPVCDIVPVDSTIAGNGDSATYSPAVTVLEGDQLTVVFVSPQGPPAVPIMGSVRIQVMVMGGVAGTPTPVAGASPAPSIPPAI